MTPAAALVAAIARRDRLDAVELELLVIGVRLDDIAARLGVAG